MSLKILMAENLPWNAQVRVGSHHIARQFLAHGHEVLWVSLPWTPIHVFRGLPLERIREWNFGYPVVVEDRLQVLSPLALLPYRNNPFLRQDWVARRLLSRSLPPLSRVLKAAGFSDVDLLWMTDPRMISIRRLTHARAWAYRCVDELSAFSDIPPGVQSLEKEVVQNSDAVFVTAEELSERLRRWRPDVHELPNAAELAHFMRLASAPNDLLSISKPRILYVGALGEWFDAELVAQTAARIPEASFVLIGPQRRPLDVLKGISNVHVLGARPYSEVPGYVQHCDVTVIPFTNSGISRAVNPVKVYEYLAAGKPVVSTPLRELERLGLPVRIAATPASFAQKIRDAVAQGESGAAARIASAAKHSWESRFLTIARIMHETTGLALLPSGKIASLDGDLQQSLCRSCSDA